MPNSLSKRATSLGYGNKKFGEEGSKFVPGVGAYSFNSDINPEKNQKKSFTFGVSREVNLFLARAWNKAEPWDY